MTAVGLIQFTQSAVSPGMGIAMVGALGSAVTASAAAGATRYLWTIVDAPVGSSLQGATQDGASASFAFTPDVRGSYRLWLQVWSAGGAYSQDIRVFTVPLSAAGYIVPPYQGNPAPLSLLIRPDECNFGGGSKGWAGVSTTGKLMAQWIADLDSIAGASTGPTGPTGPQGPTGPTGPTGPVVAGTAGQVLQYTTSWTAQDFLRTPGAKALAGTSGFVRATDGDVIAGTITGGTSYPLLSANTTGLGGGPVLGDAGLYSATIRASASLRIEVGAAVVYFTVAGGLNMGGAVITTLGTPAGSTDAVNLGYIDPVTDANLTVETVSKRLHLHFEGAAWTDSSQCNHTFTAVGSPTRDTGTKKIGSSALYTAGNAANYLKVTSHKCYFEWDDCSFQQWVYVTGTGYCMWLSFTDSGDTDGIGPLLFVDNSSSKIVFAWSTSGGGWAGSIASNSTMSTIGLNAWHHVAVDRTAGLVRMYIDGTPQTATAYAPYFYTGDQIRIGQHNGSPMLGYLDEVCVDVGLARWKGATFTAPTAALTDFTAPSSAGYEGRHYKGAKAQGYIYLNGIYRPVRA